MKRFVSVFLAFLILLSSMCFGCIDALALPAVDMPGGSFEVVPGGLDDVPRDITWTAELLYSFELFLNSVGVRVTSKAVPAVALAWEAQAKADSPEFYAELAELSQMDGIERLDTLFGNTWASSIRDFFVSDACTGYGTADFLFSSGVVDIVNDVLKEVFEGIYKRYSTKVSPNGYHYSFSFSAQKTETTYDSICCVDVYEKNNCDFICFYLSNDFLYAYAVDVKGNTNIYQPMNVCVSYLKVYRDGNISWTYGDITNASIRLVPSNYLYPDLRFQHFPYPVFSSLAKAESYAATGVLDGDLRLLGGFENLYTSEKIASAVPSLQAEALVKVPVISEVFTIPSTAEEREEVLKNVREADTSETLVKALADAGVSVGDNVDNPPVTDVEPSLDGITKVLSSILSAIISIPDRIITGLKELLISLFVPSPDYFSNKIDSLLSLLKSVLPYADYINMLETIGSFSGGELKDITVTIMGATATIVSFKSMRDVLPVIRSWARGVYFILIVIYHINQVYKLLRNTRIIDGISSMSGGKE